MPRLIKQLSTFFAITLLLTSIVVGGGGGVRFASARYTIQLDMMGMDVINLQAV